MRPAINLMELLLNLIYTVLKSVVPIKNKIVLLSRQSDTPSLDFQLLDEEIKRRGVRTVILCKMLEKTASGLVSYCFHMLRQMYHMAGARVLILDGYCIAASMLRHKRNLKIIQIWHSMGSMKKFGYTAMGKEEGSSFKLAKAMKMHCNYDYVLISSEAYRTDMAKGFNCSADKIRIYPLPRLDLLTEAKPYGEEIREKIYTRYGQLRDKENILYCPTFRKGDESGLEKALNSLIKEIDFQTYNLIVKLHPLSEITVTDNRVVIAKEFSTFDTIFVADYVISDYSCVVYEAAVRNIPLYFFAFDEQQYKGNRGLAIDYEQECPGMISDDANIIYSEIETGVYNWDALHAFAEKYVQPTRHATKDMVDFICCILSNECKKEEQHDKDYRY